MQKPIVYVPVPVFDQETQYVVQLEPVETADAITFGVKVLAMPPQKPNERRMTL